MGSYTRLWWATYSMIILNDVQINVNFPLWNDNYTTIFCTVEPVLIWGMWVQDILLFGRTVELLSHPFLFIQLLLLDAAFSNYTDVYKMSYYDQYNVACGGVTKEEMSLCIEGGKGCGIYLCS